MDQDDGYNYNWAALPPAFLAQIFSFLSINERENIGDVCARWKESLDHPMLWQRFVCSFFQPSDVQYLEYVHMYGRFITNLVVELDQSEKVNRENSLKFFKLMSDLNDSKLTHLSVRFKGEKPLFYSGIEFTSALSKIFELNGEKKEFSKLSHLNLSGLEAVFTDQFIDTISSNCPNITYLNILNNLLTSNVSPQSLKQLVKRCRKLQVLHTYHNSINDAVLESFTEKDRARLLRLGIVCRRVEKYSEDISSSGWSELVKSNPDLRVELGFDHTCPYFRVSEIMKPEIPIIELHLATFTLIYPEINLATNYYDKYLEQLVVHTIPSKELDEALLHLAQHCRKLHTLCVYCLVDRDVVDKIHSLYPEMEKRGSYILKWEMEPEPWTVGKEEGD